VTSPPIAWAFALDGGQMQKDTFRPSDYSDHDSDALEALRKHLAECAEAVPMAEPAKAEGWRSLDPLRGRRKGRRARHQITRR
jgi:hypothetical protein